MANITFNKKIDGSGYEFRGTVTADFNLHLEFDKSSLVSLRETTVPDTQYAKVFSGFAEYNSPIDIDRHDIIYPKYILIESQYEPSKAYLTETGSKQWTLGDSFPIILS